MKMIMLLIAMEKVGYIALMNLMLIFTIIAINKTWLIVIKIMMLVAW